MTAATTITHEAWVKRLNSSIGSLARTVEVKGDVKIVAFDLQRLCDAMGGADYMDIVVHYGDFTDHVDEHGVFYLQMDKDCDVSNPKLSKSQSKVREDYKVKTEKEAAKAAVLENREALEGSKNEYRRLAYGGTKKLLLRSGVAGTFGLLAGGLLSSGLYIHHMMQQNTKEFVISLQGETTQQETLADFNKRMQRATALSPVTAAFRKEALLASKLQSNNCLENPAPCFETDKTGKYTIIPYTVDASTATHAPFFAPAVYEAIQQIERSTSIRFVPVLSGAKFIFRAEAEGKDKNHIAWARYPEGQNQVQEIRINTSHWDQDPKQQAKRVEITTHEIMHGLGLGHIQNHPESIMYVIVDQNGVERSGPDVRIGPFPKGEKLYVRAAYGCDGRDVGCDDKEKPVHDNTQFEKDSAGKWQARERMKHSLPKHEHQPGFHPRGRGN